MKEVKLPSGAVLQIHMANFETARGLYQAVLEELQDIPIDSKNEVGNTLKNLFCRGFASKKIEAILWEIFKKCTYNNGKTGNLKIDKDTFEPVEARQDYTPVCIEVAKENIGPFVKSLYAEYERVITMTGNTQT